MKKFSLSAKKAERAAMQGLRAGALVLLLFSCQVKFKANLDVDEAGSVAAQTSMSSNWPFTFGTDGDYTFNTSLLDFTGGVVRLTPTDQTDDGNTASGFGGGTASGVSWDATNSHLRLTQTGTPTNTADLDESWAPKWANLQFYWKMQGTGNVSGVNFAIDKGADLCRASSGTPAYATGKLSNGIAINSGQGIICTGTSVRNIANDITIAGWFKHSGGVAVADAEIYGTYDGSTGWYVRRDGTNNHMEVSVSTSGQTDAQCGAGKLGGFDGNWHHIAFTVSSGTIKAYMDGALRETCAYTHGGGFASGWNPWFMGMTAAGTTTLDDFGVWNDDLSASEIALLYERQSASYSGTLVSRVMDALTTGMSWTTLSWVPTLPFFKELPDYAGGSVQNETSTSYSSLVGSTGATGANDLMTGIEGLWHLNENAATGGAANDFADDSGKGNPGEGGGGVVFGEFGKLGKAASFDGANSYVEMDGSGTLSGVTSSSFSMSAWTKVRAYPTVACATNSSTCNGAIFVRDFDTGLIVDGTGKFIATLWNSTMTQYLLGSSAAAVGVWHHVVMTVNDTAKELRLYLNGTEVAGSPVTYAGTLRNWGTNDYYVGRNNATDPLTDGNYAFPFDGWVDEAVVWSRVLHANEVKQLYRRGANRIKYQVRICTAADCSDDATGANWKGPDGTRYSYFSELHNNSVALDYTGNVQKALPSMLFSDFTAPVGTSRYFQYRTILESDDTSTSCNYGSGATWCSPELKSVTVDPVHYTSSNATIVSDNGISFDALDSFTETLGGGGCPGGIGYNLSLDKVTWYYWSGAAWIAANGTVAQSNTAADIDTNAAAFGTQVGTGTIYIKAFLKSSGSQACELDAVSVTGTQ